MYKTANKAQKPMKNEITFTDNGNFESLSVTDFQNSFLSCEKYVEG